MDSPKARARAALKAARASVDPEQRAVESEAAVRALLASDLLNGAATVALFAAMDSEADPSSLEAALVARGVATAYPRVTGGELRFHRAIRSELIPSGAWRIREPLPDAPPADRIDAYLVPGLGFTRRGERIGYGRGFYDRVLVDRGTAHAIGFAFACQLVDHLPTEAHDQRLDAVVTSLGVIVVVER